jgi:TAT (twin-arginine translocation) pathway signal sequence
MTRLPSRRTILQGGAALGALAVTPGCHRRSDPKHEPGTLRDDLWHLVLLIGPWTAADRAQADAVIPRYLSDERVKRFEPDRASFALLAARFANHAPAAESIDLAELSPAERAALVTLTTDLYGAIPVRCAASGTPEPGQCLADPQWQAQVPPR